MGPFGIPWATFIVGVFAGPGMLVAAILLINSRWWKEKTEYYFSWNEKDS